LRDDREPVAFAHRLRSDHLDAEVEIGRHARYHPKLLIVLFAEDCEIRPYLREKLADDGRDPAEEMRSKTIFQTCGCRPLRHDARGEAVRIHGLDVGIPDQVDRFRRQLRYVGFPRARIGGKVFGRRELRDLGLL